MRIEDLRKSRRERRLRAGSNWQAPTSRRRCVRDGVLMFDMSSLPSQGWLEADEASLLLGSADLTEGPILEVGCFHGRSTIVLASLGRPIISVDPFENFNTCDMSGEVAHRSFLENLKSHSIHSVTLHVMKIEDWKTEPVGFAYLDGDHTYQGTVNQIEAALSCGATRICVHDYDRSGSGFVVKQAVDNNPRLLLIRTVGRMASCEVLK